MTAWKQKIEKGLLYFVLAQVPIDVLTTFVLKVLHITITPGLIFRALAIVVMGSYLLIYGSNKIRIYVAAVALYMLFQFYYGIVQLHGSIGDNFNYHFRTVYYVLAFLAYFHILKSKWGAIALRYLTANAFMIGIVFVLATITGIYTLSYQGEERLGHQAWFASANEVSIIVCILLFHAGYQWFQRRNWYHFVTLALMVFTNVELGTKTNLIALVLFAGCSFYLFIIDAIRRKAVKAYLVVFLLAGIVAGLAAINTKFIPPVYNSIWQVDFQKEINFKQGLKEGAAVPIAYARERYAKQKANPQGKHIESVSFIRGEKNVIVSGFYYIYGTDIRHPNYTSKQLELLDLTTATKVTIPLADTYNRNITDTGSYDSSFAGLYGEFNLDQIKKHHNYELSLVQTVDDYKLSVPLNDSVAFITAPLLDYMKSDGDTFTFSHTRFLSEDGAVEGPTQSKYFFLLSNRNKRVADLDAYLRATHPNYVWIGASYIGNHKALPFVHLEMDYVELFYTYGLIGFILFMIPLLYLLFQLIRGLFRNWRIMLVNPFILLYGSAVLLVLVIGMFSGCTISRPNVVIYIALLFSIAYGYFNVQETEIESK